MKRPGILILFFYVVLLSGCGNDSSPTLTPEEILKIDKIQNPFDKPVEWVSREGSDDRVSFGVQDCNIYKGDQTSNGVIIGWTVFIKVGGDRVFNKCYEESIVKLDGYLVFEIGTQARYSGNVVYRDFRTRNGFDWETRENPKLDRYGSFSRSPVDDQWKKYDRFKGDI